MTEEHNDSEVWKKLAIEARKNGNYTLYEYYMAKADDKQIIDTLTGPAEDYHVFDFYLGKIKDMITTDEMKITGVKLSIDGIDVAEIISKVEFKEVDELKDPDKVDIEDVMNLKPVKMKVKDMM